MTLRLTAVLACVAVVGVGACGHDAQQPPPAVVADSNETFVAFQVCSPELQLASS